MSSIVWLIAMATILSWTSAMMYGLGGMIIYQAASPPAKKLRLATGIASLAWPAVCLTSAAIVAGLGLTEKAGLAAGSEWVLAAAGIIGGHSKIMLVPIVGASLLNGNIIVFGVAMAVLLAIIVWSAAGAKAEKSSGGWGQKRVDELWEKIGGRKEKPPKLVISRRGGEAGFMALPGRDIIWLNSSLVSQQRAEHALNDEEVEAVIVHELAHGRQNELVMWLAVAGIILGQTIGLFWVMSGQVELIWGGAIVAAVMAASKAIEHQSEKQADRLCEKMGLGEALYSGILKMVENGKQWHNVVYWAGSGISDEHGQPMKRQIRLGQACGLSRQEVIEEIGRGIIKAGQEEGVRKPG